MKTVRFLLSLVKNIQNLPNYAVLRTIPWMDFSKHYTEKDVCQYCGISDELWNYIDKFIPDYYKDYDEIK